jgi:hypothetical protein
MNRESLLQTLRVHVMRLHQQKQRQDGFVLGCTVDELVAQVEGLLSTEKPDFGFADALARLQTLMDGSSPAPSTNATPMMPPSAMPHRRGSIGSAGSISEIIDAEAMVSRHQLKSLA